MSTYLNFDDQWFIMLAVAIWKINCFNSFYPKTNYNTGVLHVTAIKPFWTIELEVTLCICVHLVFAAKSNTCHQFTFWILLSIIHFKRLTLACRIQDPFETVQFYHFSYPFSHEKTLMSFLAHLFDCSTVEISLGYIDQKLVHYTLL